MLASLAVSHYIYDRSALYDFRWMRERLPRAPRNWVNIHSGLDQTSQILRSVFPNSDGQILDIYDPTEMTEPSIARARELSSGGSKALAADFRHLPLPDSSCDAVFLIFSVHELRQRDSRVEFFKEVARVLAANGTVILVEHLRDPACMMRRLRSWLKPDGCLVASIPNVRHHSVVRGLLSGKGFTFSDRGAGCCSGQAAPGVSVWPSGSTRAITG